jgi:hypothetical protein
MRRRTRSKRYINARFPRGAAITALLLWVGLLLFGILNYDRPEAQARTEAATRGALATTEAKAQPPAPDRMNIAAERALLIALFKEP